MNKLILAGLITVCVSFGFVAQVSAMSSLEQEFLKKTLNKAERQKAEQGIRIANMDCPAAMETLSQIMFFSDGTKSDTKRRVHEVGLAMAILKETDFRTYKTVRSKVLNGKTDQLKSIFSFDPDNGKPCEAGISFKDVLFSSINYQV